MSLEIRKIPVISTAHMPYTDCWPEVADDVVVYDTECGHIVSVNTDSEIDVPLWYQHIVHWATKHNYEWIWFDCDAATVPDLPVFDW